MIESGRIDEDDNFNYPWEGNKWKDKLEARSHN